MTWEVGNARVTAQRSGRGRGTFLKRGADGEPREGKPAEEECPRPGGSAGAPRLGSRGRPWGQREGQRGPDGPVAVPGPGCAGGGRRGRAGEGCRGAGRAREPTRARTSWRAAETYLLVRDPLRLLQAERAAEGAVLRHHAQAAGGAHQLLGIAARGHLGGHDAAPQLARRPPPATRPSPPRAPPRPAPPARLTAPAPNRHALPGAQANRRLGPAPSLRSPIAVRAPPLPPCARPPIGSEGRPQLAPPPRDA